MKKIVTILSVSLLMYGSLFSQSTNCSTATNLTLNNGSVCVNGTSAGAITDNILYGSCNTAPVNMVWYTYVTNGSNNNFTITPNTLTNAEIVIYQGGCPNTGTLQNCVTATGSNPIVTNWGMTAGVQVWIGIASNGGVDGSFQFCVKSTTPAASPGNTCAQAKLVCTTPFVQSTIPSNSSGQAPACFGSAPQQDIWIKFTITQPGLLAWTATPNNTATEFDWALWDITNGCPGTLACCNYNYAAGSNLGFGMQAQSGTVACGSGAAAGDAAEFSGPMNVTCGKTYAIQISNYSNNNTGFSLSFANSTALITSNSAFSVGPSTLVCGSSLNAIINNSSTGACAQVWNFGDGSPTYTGTAPPNHNYTTPGTYAITANIPGACPSSATQFVQLLAPLAATVTPTPMNCFGQCTGSATLAPITGGDGIYTYLWSTGSTSTSVSGLCAGVYSVTVSNAKCSSSITKTVSIVAPPQLSLTANGTNPTCAGNNGSVTASAAGGTSPYTYAINAGAFSGSSSFTGLSAGNYTVYVKDNKNCITSATLALTAPPNPTITVTSATSCANVPVTLSASGASNYTWSPSTGLSSTTGTSVTATLGSTQNYTVIGAIGTCTGSATTSVLINPLPTPAASNGGPYCPGNTIQLNVGAFTTYTWTGASFSSNSQNPTIASATPSNSGVYTVSVTNANGCVNSSTTNVVVNPLPNPVVGSNSPVCLNNNISLTATGGTGYSWSGPNSFTSLLQNPTVTNASTLDAGVYTVTVTASGCSNTGTVNVIVTSPTTSATNSGPYCEGTSIQLSNPGATSYTWSGPGGYASNSQNPAIASSTPSMSGIYSVLVSIGTCTATASTSVTVNALPTPSASNTGAYCPGNTIQLNVGAFTTYTWTGPSFSSNSQNPTIASATPSNSGVYTVSVTNASGCVNSSTTNVVVNPLPNPVVGSNSPVCLNNNISLTATGGTGYSWSGPNGFTSLLQNPTVTNASTLNAGVYTVTVTALGCSNTGTVNVIVTTPTTSATNSGPYCEGTSIQLSNPGATSYTWSGPGGYVSNAQNPTIASSTPSMSGIYSVLVSIGTCTATASTSVTVNALPTPSASNTGAYCPGNTIQLNVGAFTTYTWTGPGSYSSNSQNASISAGTTTNSGVYTVSVTDLNGCINSSTTNVIVNPLPNPVVGSNSPVCLNNNISLTATGGTGYSWSGPNSFTSLLQNPTVTNASTLNAGVYTVTVTALGCSNTGTVNVVVSTPTTSAANSGPYCAGSTIQLSSPGATSYTWSGPGGYVSNAQNPTLTSSAPSMSGIYSILVSIGTCTATANTSVTVNALPTPLAGGNSPVCIGMPINFNGNGGTSYVWNGPAGFNSVIANPTIAVSSMASAGNYTLTVTDNNGCSNSTVYAVVVNSQPVVSAAGTNVCENTNVQLTATGGVSYSWSGPGGFTSLQQNPVIPNAGIGATGQYIVTVTDANTCTNTAVANVTVNAAPVPTVITNGPVCVKTVLSLSASGGLTYSWTGPNGFVSALQNPTIAVNSLSVAGIYQVNVTGSGGCIGTQTVNVIVNNLPVPVLTSGPNKGCAPLCVTYSLESTPAAAAVNWSFGNGINAGSGLIQSSCYNAPGIYTIQASVTDINGCSGTTGHTVEVYPKPTADFVYSPIKPIENLDMVNFSDISFGTPIVAWNWYFLAGTQFSSQLQNLSHIYKDAGEYPIALIVKSDKGCVDTVIKTIKVIEDFGIWVPNAFTPNGDGLNDGFSAKGYGIVKFHMQIFDRWGESIFVSDNILDPWFGNYQGRGDEICQDDVYVWIIRASGINGKEREFTGHVTLLK